MELITKPGVYDIPAEVYHADPVAGGSLSSTGARKLLPPSCPARFDYDRRHGQKHKEHFDLGHAAHQQVLGTGPEIAVVDAENWRTKAAQEQRKDAYAAGQVPLLTADWEQVQAMAAAIRAHPIAAALFAPGTGLAEQTLVWQDPVTGVMLRARFDWLPFFLRGQRTIIGDYKTTACAEPEAIRKHIFSYGYHLQDDFYTDGALTLGVAGPDPAFVFVFQEKEPPYLITIVEPDSEALMWARMANQRAISLYAWCTETGRWPGYADDVLIAELPRYAITQYETAQARGHFDLKEIR